jgi:hypothetical protein
LCLSEDSKKTILELIPQLEKIIQSNKNN